MSQELKNCPCCKGPAIYNEDLNRFYAECHHCQLRTASYRTKKRAAEIWNTRHDDWISVEDRLPELAINVLVNGGVAVYDEGVWYSVVDEFREMQWDVTHWKPITLPEVE